VEWQEQSKKGKKKNKNLFLLVFILFILYLSPSIYHGVRDYIEYSKKVEALIKREQALQKDVKALREIAYNMDDPYIIEKLAREKLFMVRPGEEPLLIIEEKGKNKDDLIKKVINLFKK